MSVKKEPVEENPNTSSGSPKNSAVQSGLLYAELRHAYNLGPPPAKEEYDEDWGVTEGFVAAEIPRSAVKPNPSFDSLVSSAMSSDAPDIKELKKELISRCRRRQAEVIERRNACPKRQQVEAELRQLAEKS